METEPTKANRTALSFLAHPDALVYEYQLVVRGRKAAQAMP